MSEWSWNGSAINLTGYTVEELKLPDVIFWRIYPPSGERFYVMVKGASSPNYCFVDQAKTIFGLQPYGCHYTYEKGSYKILFKISYHLGPSPPEDIVVGWSSFDFGYLREYINQIITIILFRACLGISPNNIGYVNVLLQDKSFALVPAYSNIFNPENSLERGISKLLERKIFRTYPDVVTECLKTMIGPHPHLFHLYRYRIQSELEAVAERTGLRCGSRIGSILFRIGIIYHQYIR